MKGAYVLSLGLVPYREAWELQRSLAGAVSQGAIPDTIVLLQHPPVVTLGRRTEDGELHIPPGAEVDVVETDRGGQVDLPRAGPARLLPDPRPAPARPGREALLPRARGGADRDARPRSASPGERIDGLTGVWLTRPPRKIASIGIHISKWVTTHGYALNVDLDPAPFTQWITACGLEDAAFTTIARELGRPVTVDEVRPHALEALAQVFGLELEDLPADEGHGLWPQPVHEQLAAR